MTTGRRQDGACKCSLAKTKWNASLQPPRRQYAPQPQLSAESIPFHATAQSTTTSADPPERSRNAEAQVRHRTKRKAYIEQVSHLGLTNLISNSRLFVQLERT
ncbi:hypothetical protein EDB85DRAFT_1874735 [Lactarius pseudohatsudake]|nr:hypothetical protein EDB85DRAFT_1874735 [Lactarius pseudohatsudake]